MTNEQYSNMMIAFAKLEAKIDSLEQEIKVLNAYVDTQLKNKYYGTDVVVTGDVKPEHLSNFWNEDRLREFDCIGDNSVPPKPFFNVEKEENVILCIWETLLPEQRTKPMGLVCPCKKCTSHSM